MAQDQKQYYAFISYNHADKKNARELQRWLEYYKLPTNLRKENPSLPKYVRPIFRDDTHLEIADLSPQIHEALEQSHYLIVVCSPNSAQSKWVNDEVEYFISLGKQDKIIPYIIEGVPYADDPLEECYPPALLQLSKEKELLGANINEVGKEAAGIRVVAKMFGIRYDMLYQRYKRDQRKKNAAILSSAITFILLLLSFLGYVIHSNAELKESNWKMMENLSRAISGKALSLIQGGDSYLAQRLLIEVLPESLDSPERPYTVEAEQALRNANRYNTAILTGHTGGVNSAIFSPDGKYIVSSSWDDTIRIWDARTGKELQTLTEHTDWVYSATFSPNGKYIVSSSSDNTIRIWDARTGMELRILKGHTDRVTSATFSPDGKYIVSSSLDKTIRIWDAQITNINGTYRRG